MSDIASGLPSPWIVKYSKTKKREYYFNPETKESHWEPPSGTDYVRLKDYLREHPVRIRCLHILIKHRDSRRPSSHHNPHITITKAEAAKELERYRDAIFNKGASFEEIARERSDCNSYKRGGDLGFFGRGEMQPDFEKAAFALKVGEISGIVDTESGLHLIKRIA
ncbi:probable Peptidyl-prolyl cis-trans isomerase ESS1 [Saccharomycodes ludwigii]|uniref:Peptidyl-prolyl cis-trans isomerase n=1 Tax=Saccharomycodes ludwigii TaxID=36035 RepID=A0A376B726_9ASCO|nr:hypothetical protein SCDLUD_004585 [Saccharomycodes ludwigii]KAH3899156.1 hypothetical protein SCDLUD_004585 [Saccharomycodes ludwigii]SSD60284.1 probable Peptidyl-prolyl cis-trans isomerase ESS1 [Saccharomycodes ludwigii]